jgi:hypothetical protein
MPILKAKIVELEMYDPWADCRDQCPIVEVGVDRDDDKVVGKGVAPNGVVEPGLIEIRGEL